MCHLYCQDFSIIDYNQFKYLTGLQLNVQFDLAKVAMLGKWKLWWKRRDVEKENMDLNPVTKQLSVSANNYI